MVSDGNMLGSGSETRRISSGQNLGRLIILKDSADSGNSITEIQVELAANFGEQGLKIHQASHASIECDAL